MYSLEINPDVIIKIQEQILKTNDITQFNFNEFMKLIMDVNNNIPLYNELNSWFITADSRMISLDTLVEKNIMTYDMNIKYCWDLAKLDPKMQYPILHTRGKNIDGTLCPELYGGKYEGIWLFGLFTCKKLLSLLPKDDSNVKKYSDQFDLLDMISCAYLQYANLFSAKRIRNNEYYKNHWAQYGVDKDSNGILY